MKKASIKNMKEVIGMKKKILIIFIILLSYLLVYFVGYKKSELDTNNRAKKLKNSVIYEVEVQVAKINLRKSVDLNSDIVKEVYKGEKLQVVEYYEGNRYNWYKVIYDENKAGWIASGKENSWVIIKGE